MANGSDNFNKTGKNWFVCLKNEPLNTAITFSAFFPLRLSTAQLFVY
jgi:hypothetical protein